MLVLAMEGECELFLAILTNYEWRGSFNCRKINALLSSSPIFLGWKIKACHYGRCA